MEIEEGLLLEISKRKSKISERKNGTKEMGKSELDKLKGVNLGNERTQWEMIVILEISESHPETSEEK